MVAAPLPGDSLHADSFLYALRTRLEEAPEEAKQDAYAGAAAWTGFVFGALAGAAAECGMVSCAARQVMPGLKAHEAPPSSDEVWTKREYLFDVTWFRRDWTDWEPPLLILEHENAWDRAAFLVDFWKLLFGYAPLRVMIGYSRHESDHDPWVGEVNRIISDERRVRLPDDVDDLILLGHRGMRPTDYAVYRRQQRSFLRTADALDSVPMPDPRDGPAWRAYVRRMQAAAQERVHREVDRLQRAGIIDAAGRVLRQTMPPDMEPSSDASTITG